MRKNKWISMVAILGLATAIVACGHVGKQVVTETTVTEETTVGQIIELESEGLYSTFLVDEPVVEKDVIYDEEKNLRLDVYMPEQEPSSQRAAIILMHGGGFTKGDKSTDELTKSFSIDLARMGYVVFNANYSLEKKVSVKAIKNACADIETAFLWVQDHCEKYGVNPNYIALGGYSAGALVAIDLVYSNDYDIPAKDVFAVIDIAGGALTFGKPKSNNPSCLILHGQDDTTVAMKDTESFIKKLEKAGVDAQLYSMKGIGHTVITRFDEMRNRTAEFLYQELTGQQIQIELQSQTNPERRKVSERKQNGIEYVVHQVDCVIDGDLGEWNGFEKMNLNELKDAGDKLPDENEFAGFAYVGWNEKKADKLYIAAQIQDNQISVSNEAKAKWYNDDCLEIIFDVSDEVVLEQLMKWVVSADANKLSVLANKENTVVAKKQNGNVTTYEIEISLNNVGEQVRNHREDTIITIDSNIGFSIAYNDSENGERKYQIGWTKGASSERKLMGNLKFEK